MTLIDNAARIHREVSAVLWTRPDIEVVKLIDGLVASVDHVELYTRNCLNYSRHYNAAFFHLSSSIWRGFRIEDWAKLLRGVVPRPEPTWAWDGGQFSDISFIVGYLKIDAYQIAACFAKLEKVELRKIIEYGIANSDLVSLSIGDTCGDEEVDEYEEILQSATSEARMSLIREAPLIDLSAVSVTEMLERLKNILPKM